MRFAVQVEVGTGGSGYVGPEPCGMTWAKTAGAALISSPRAGAWREVVFIVESISERDMVCSERGVLRQY